MGDERAWLGLTASDPGIAPMSPLSHEIDDFDGGDRNRGGLHLSASNRAGADLRPELPATRIGGLG